MMRSLLTLAVLIGTIARPAPAPTIPGTFVSFDDLHSCPHVGPRSAPSVVYDLRPDDISVVMALGDSVTAGFLARSPGLYRQDSMDHAQRPMVSVPATREYRGLSYPIGGDEGAITFANILQHWSTGLRGMSRGHHPLVACVGGWCVSRYDDGLNAAISGSTSQNLVPQVKGYLLPKVEEMGLDPESWKFVNIGIGSNDICAFCLSPNSTLPLIGNPRDFVNGIRDAVELLRQHVPNIVVNIVGLLRVSEIYKLTLKDPYCRGPLLPPVPHLPMECSCALLPGPAGDYTRSKMDELAAAYDEAVKELIRGWTAEQNSTFGALWQPGTVIDLEHYPIEAVSPVDCFHPSEAAHQRVAAGFWNRLTRSAAEKAIPIQWLDDVLIRCLEEDDRIQVGL